MRRFFKVKAVMLLAVTLLACGKTSKEALTSLQKLHSISKQRP